MQKNLLYYGDNLDVLRRHIHDDTIDLCYIDPPFNSKRTYNQIYNKIGHEDRAQSQAFIDMWTWDDHANDCLGQVLTNANRVQTRQSVDLIRGLDTVLGRDSLLAYLVSMTVRIAEIRRVLKPTGSFFLHCDPTVSHYVKLVCDAIFVAQGGDFQNEIIWSYRRWPAVAYQFQRMHDVILFYSKSNDKGRTFNVMFEPNSESYQRRFKGKTNILDKENPTRKLKVDADSKGLALRDVWDIPIIAGSSKERLGYPTQKPEALLERIIKASSNEGDTVLDAYCGCGTTTSVAQRLNRHWIGIDITYRSISIVLRRLEQQYGKEVLKRITLNGIPRDMESAQALAHKQDDRVRKEFEKWAVITYSNNRAIINDKKGADRGIDGIAYFMKDRKDNAKIVFQVKSGGVKRSDVATLRGDMEREQAAIAILITLEKPTHAMIEEAKAAGIFEHEMMGRSYDRMQIVTVKEIIEQDKRLDVPTSLEVLKAARRAVEGGDQLGLEYSAA